MAGLTEEEVYEALVYLIEITDAVIGGANGIANLQAKQLANRTAWLKANKQDKDATLTAIAALTAAADKMIYATGSDAFAMTTLTAFARTLLDDVDASAMRATLGAQIAGNYQAAGNYQIADETLTALAGLTTAANKMIYATGVDTFTTTTLSAFARTLLDDADAAAMRATLGVDGALSDAGHSFGVNGYMKLSNGFILQWGTSASVPTNGSLVVTLPIAFPTACLNASATPTDGSGTDVPLTVGAKSTTNITIYNTSNAAAYNAETAQPSMWFAIGY